MESVLLEDSEFHNPELHLNDNTKKENILKLMRQFKLMKSQLIKIQNIFKNEMDLGLELNDNGNKSSLLMENTFVPSLPDGTEDGDFLSLDLGGTNFRVLLSRLKPGENAEIFLKYYEVPVELRTGVSAKLFDFLADSIADFINEYIPDHNNTLPLGFTFSFPMDQKAIDIGILLLWTKKFDCPDAVGTDAAKQLQDAINRRNDIKVNVVAILNDSTGTLANGAYLASDCAIGMILGTGFNICYVEKIECIKKWVNRDSLYSNATEVIIDIESGAFGDNGILDFIKTDIDFNVDRNSLFPKSYTFEKLFSGHFIGDVVSGILNKLIEQNLLFDNYGATKSFARGSITGTDVSDIETNDHTTIVNILSRIGFDNVSMDDIIIIQHVCAVISVRCAHLLSAILSVLIERIDKSHMTIAIDGSVYKNHPKMHTLLTDFIAHFVGPKRIFKLILAEDGSGKGAGLIAAIAQKLKNNNNN